MTENDLLVQAAQSTQAIADTLEYRQWLTRLQMAAIKVRMMQDERGVKRAAMYTHLTETEYMADELIKKCDDWLENAREKHERLMVEVMGI
jgi:hypothetical protein